MLGQDHAYKLCMTTPADPVQPPEIVPPNTPFIDPPGPHKGPDEPPVIPPGQPYIDPPGPMQPGPNRPFIDPKT